MNRLSRREIDVLASGRSATPRSWLIDGLDHTETLRSFPEVLAAAVAELRESDFSSHDYRVLEGIRDRISGEEREAMERVLAITTPRSTPVIRCSAPTVTVADRRIPADLETPKWCPRLRAEAAEAVERFVADGGVPRG